MGDILFDYLEEARKLIQFTRKVCELDRDGQTLDVEAQRDYKSIEGNDLKFKPSISIALHPSKSNILSACSTKIGDAQENPKSTSRPEVPLKYASDEKVGNDILRNSDFVKLSDSEDEISLPVADDHGQMSKHDNHILWKDHDAATSADASMQRVAPEQNKMQQKPGINRKFLYEHSTFQDRNIALQESQKLPEREFDKNIKTNASKLHQPGNKTKRLKKQLKKTRELVESAHKSSNLVFTLLGEGKKVVSGPQRPPASLPPTCLPPPPPPQPPMPPPPSASFSPIIDNRYQHHNSSYGKGQQMQYLMQYPGSVAVHPPNNNTYLYNNSALSSQQGTLQTHWPAHNQGTLFPFSSYEQPTDVGLPSIQPTSVNNRLAYLPMEKGLPAEGSSKYQHPNSQIDSVVNAKRTLPSISRQKVKAKAKARASAPHRKKKKAPKSLKRIDGMVRKYDLGDNV